ncbi:unnamed protein product, partial [Allacma fusca]
SGAADAVAAKENLLNGFLQNLNNVVEDFQTAAAAAAKIQGNQDIAGKIKDG